MSTVNLSILGYFFILILVNLSLPKFFIIPFHMYNIIFSHCMYFPKLLAYTYIFNLTQYMTFLLFFRLKK